MIASHPSSTALVVAFALGGPPLACADCVAPQAPFSTIPGADLVRTDFTSKDTPPVAYAMWRGTVPSFDGLPLSVDVTIPCGVEGPLPLVSMNHGWTDDKTLWEETGRSDTVVSSTFRRGSNSYWNNIWFASRGYAVLTYTARGFHDSCGPRTPGALGALLPAPHCLVFEYWIHTDDLRWEIRDTQWLVAGLVESAVADPRRLAITGGSYGGGQTSMNALLHDRTMCGGAPVPAALGTDPCAGKGNGDLVPWTTRDGLPLRWAAAVPMYTWSDSIGALYPNGRRSDGMADAPAAGDPADPLGIPLESYIMGIYAGGQPIGNGYYAPPWVDPETNVTVSTARTLAGNPFPAFDPFVVDGVREFRTFKSPILIPLERLTPIFWVQGLTDPLFTAIEPLEIQARMRSHDVDAPIKLFFGDFGHDYAAERIDEWDHAHELMNEFVDHYLRPDRTPDPPAFDVTATITRCLDPEAPMEIVNGPDWESLHPDRRTFVSTESAVTASDPPGRMGIATDPVTGATLPLPGSYRGCRTVSPSASDPLTASWTFDIAEDLLLLGSPVVDVTFATTGPDTQLHVRLWDIAGDGSVQGLVTRGAYRALDGPGTDLRARFQIAANGYRFRAGHRLKVEIAGNDAPFHQRSNVPFTAVIRRIEIILPLSIRVAELRAEP